MEVIIISIIFVGCLSLFLYTWKQFRRTVYIRVSANKHLLTQYPLPKRLASFRSTDQTCISAWYIPVDTPKAVVILVHGYTSENGGKALMLPHADYLHEAGYSTFLIDMRSVGESEGNKVTFGVREWEDLAAAYDYLKTLPENKDLPIGYLGISMGGSTAIIAAGETQKGDFVIASVPFASYKSLFTFQIEKEKLPVFVFWPFLDLCARLEFGWDYHNYAPASLIKNIHVPLFIITAEEDQMVNSNDGKMLYDAANNPKQYWRAHTRHDVYHTKPVEFKKRVVEFLNSSGNHRRRSN